MAEMRYHSACGASCKLQLALVPLLPQIII
jgi:hypothetical protein